MAAEDVDPEVVGRLRSICLALPDAYEESAWTGVRWCVRKKTFAHVLEVSEDGPDAYARFTTSDGPVTVVTFRAPPEELAALEQAGPPLFVARWGRDVVGLELDDATAWDELEELLTDSYCVMAPQKLVRQVLGDDA